MDYEIGDWVELEKEFISTILSQTNFRTPFYYSHPFKINSINDTGTIIVDTYEYHWFVERYQIKPYSKLNKLFEI